MEFLQVVEQRRPVREYLELRRHQRHRAHAALHC